MTRRSPFRFDLDTSRLNSDKNPVPVFEHHTKRVSSWAKLGTTICQVEPVR